jgi:mannose-6-phosphate isomerase
VNKLCQFLAHQRLHTSFAIDDACDLRKLRAEFVSEKHRLANPGKIPAFLIEVQSGPYLDEDDITRFEDIYGRSASEN